MQLKKCKCIFLSHWSNRQNRARTATKQQQKMDNKNTRIFISHSSEDALIGEAFLDFLIVLGVPKESVFFSSQFHTGVPYGKNFHDVVKSKLNECETIIFLLTPNFYRSSFCMNEMGAAWILDKQIFPILIPPILPQGMLGFIDSRFIAYKVGDQSHDSIFATLKKHINEKSVSTKDNIQCAFDKFSNYAASVFEKYVEPMATSTSLPIALKMLMENQFIDDEILVFNFFIERKDNVASFESLPNENIDYAEINEYAQKYANFDFWKGVTLLSRTEFLTHSVGFEFVESDTITLNIKIFRALISAPENVIDRIESVKARHVIASSVAKAEDSTEIEKWIMNHSFTEIEGLIVKYMLDFSKFNLGDRWMGEQEKRNIKRWENINHLNSSLSDNYDIILRKIINMEFVDVKSETSYGNPREYEFKSAYKKQLNNISEKALKKLSEIVLKNKIIEKNEFEDVPF